MSVFTHKTVYPLAYLIYQGVVKILWISLSNFKSYRVCNTSKSDNLILLLTKESERLSIESSGKLLYNFLHFKSKFTKKPLSYGLVFLESVPKLIGATDKNKSVDSENHEKFNDTIAPMVYINRSKVCVVTVEWNKPLYIPNPEPIHVRINPHVARLPLRNIIIATREKENKLSRLKVTALIIK